nr:MAG TPA: hypothetical protein [Caudoviricetes sp.]
MFNLSPHSKHYMLCMRNIFNPFYHYILTNKSFYTIMYLG